MTTTEPKKPVLKRKKAVSAPKKNTKRTARNLPARVPQPKANFTKQSRILRNQGATDFIVDDEGRSVRWHYERTDRLYSQTVAYGTFEAWAKEDKWIDRRVEFWQQMEQRVVAHYSDRIFRQRLQEMGKLEELVETYEQYLLPMRDSAGNIVINKDTNLPMFGLKLPRLDQFADMYLKLHERLMLLRGEAITRSDQINRESKVTAHTDDPVSTEISLNRTEARAMARALLHERQKVETPALAEANTVVKDDKLSRE